MYVLPVVDGGICHNNLELADPQKQTGRVLSEHTGEAGA